MSALIDLTGQHFDRLIVHKRGKSSNNNKAMWLCMCVCGTPTTVRGDHLRAGLIRSCGCYEKEIRLMRVKTVQHREQIRNLGHNNTIHGHTKGYGCTPEYLSYLNAKGRCTNPNDISWERYGGRGIEFRFNSFEEWYAELGDKPEPKHMYSVNRINNDGHYVVGNIEWATNASQACNRRKRSANKRPRKDLKNDRTTKHYNQH